MCLFSTTNAECCHEECKNFYSMNEMYGLKKDKPDGILRKREPNLLCSDFTEPKPSDKEYPTGLTGCNGKLVKKDNLGTLQAAENPANQPPQNHYPAKNASHQHQHQQMNYPYRYPMYPSTETPYMMPQGQGLGYQFNTSYPIMTGMPDQSNLQMQPMSTAPITSPANVGEYIMDLRNANLNMHINMQLMKEKVDNIQKMLTYFVREWQHQNANTSEEKKQGDPKETENFNQLIGKGSQETIDKKELLWYMKGEEKEFSWRLIAEVEIESPLVKERNFVLRVRLVDEDGNLVKNNNKIYLEVSLYTEDIPPLQIKTTTSGQSILKGGCDRPLYDGEASFPKLQIKEVTSHYRNGKVFLVVQPCQENYTAQVKKEKQANYVDYDQIEPLIISDVSVKAKIQKKLSKGGRENTN